MMLKLTLSRAALIGCFLTAIMAGAADAQEFNRNHIIRSVLRAAETTANSSTIDQQGAGNAAAVVQNGEGNNAGIRQLGRNNTGAITQTGDNNNACLIQIGRGLDGSIAQVGDSQSAGVLQTRRGSQSIPPELCSTDRRGRAIGILRHAARRVEHGARGR